MIEIEKKESCTGCGACKAICPKSCISMKTDEEGFWYPQVNVNACIDCDKCKKVCPVLNKKEIEKDSIATKAIAAYNKDLEIRRESSSGGIFTLLAKYVLAKKGMVYGAALSEDCKAVCHIGIEDEKELYKLRTSKYVQSDIGNAYICAKKQLDDGRIVLFTGTPCQIEGLYSFLGGDRINLFTQDIVCHGVPSPYIWKRNVEYLEKKYKKTIKSVSFRDKEKGWENIYVRYMFSDGQIIRLQAATQDLYFKAFGQNLTLRPSCYECSFKKVQRLADITLADFWGINDYFPELNDSNGTSLVMIHSKKGETIWRELEINLIQKSCEIEIVKKVNPCVCNSVNRPSKRKKLMKKISGRSIDGVLKRYTRRSCKSYMQAIWRRIKRITRLHF